MRFPKRALTPAQFPSPDESLPAAHHTNPKARILLIQDPGLVAALRRRLRRLSGITGNAADLKRLIERTSSSVHRLIRLGGTADNKKILRELDRCIRRIGCDHRNDARSVVITGYPRIGKTALAKVLATRYGFCHLELDRLRPVYFGIEEPGLRHVARSYFLERLLEKFPRGLVLEGDDLISANRYDDGEIRPLSLDMLQRLSSCQGVSCFIVGDKDADPDVRAAALSEFQQRHDCWTARESGWEDLNVRARESIKTSQELYVMASGKAITYLALDPGNFDESVSEAADQIAHRTSNLSSDRSFLRPLTGSHAEDV
jgi:hypothetical protein